MSSRRQRQVVIILAVLLLTVGSLGMLWYFQFGRVSITSLPGIKHLPFLKPSQEPLKLVIQDQSQLADLTIRKRDVLSSLPDQLQLPPEVEQVELVLVDEPQSFSYSALDDQNNSQKYLSLNYHNTDESKAVIWMQLNPAAATTLGWTQQEYEQEIERKLYQLLLMYEAVHRDVPLPSTEIQQRMQNADRKAREIVYYVSYLYGDNLMRVESQ